MNTDIVCRVNGTPVHATVEPRTLLSDFLRHQLGLTGTHVGCEQGVCGICTVQVDGIAMRSCLMLAVQVDGRAVRTVEALGGVGADGSLHPIQAALRKHHGLQCGFCTPGFVMTIEAALREEKAGGATAEVDGVLCRCTGYQGIRDALLELRGAATPLSTDEAPSA